MKGKTGMKIAIDAMGGDSAPAYPVQGSLQAIRDDGFHVVLVGDEEAIRRELPPKVPDRVEIVRAKQAIGMNEHPTTALRKKPDASISVAVGLVKAGRADAVVAGGNTGAAAAAALLTLGRLRGVHRPAIATPLPTRKDMMILLDGGATVDCKPKNLLQFAIMGDAYMRYGLGRSNPRIGLLSLGTERSKGNELVVQAYPLLEASGLNFVGNAEGRDILSGDFDVVVCDGFVGNIVLKLMESVGEYFVHSIRKAVSAGFPKGDIPEAMAASFRELNRKFDYSEYGGAPLLGTQGICIICHGASSAKAIANAIRVAARAVSEGLNDAIMRRIDQTGEAGG